MRHVVLVLVLAVSAALGGLSGLYTIKPEGGGDFLSLYAAGEALADSGISGNCVFEIYGDTLDGEFLADGVAGSDSWTSTFRPGPGASPVLLDGDGFLGASYHNVKLESLRFIVSRITVVSCSGWRISGCRISTHDWGVKLEGPSTHDTVDGNRFDVWGVGMGHYPIIVVESGSDNVIFNNMFSSESCSTDPLIDFEGARNTRFVFNTVLMSPLEADFGNCLWVDGQAPCEVSNNVFVLARPADTVNACVSIHPTSDSVLLDNNCYFVESLGWVGARPFYPDLYDWDEWRAFGFEANGINADPMLVGTTNMHLRQGSPCIGAATPIAGIGFDIDGDPRAPVHPDIGADEFMGGGIEEGSKPQAASSKLTATVIRGVLLLAPVTSRKPQAAGLMDIGGRKVLDLVPGANDVSHLPSGVYFVREQSAISSKHSGQASATKVIIQH